MMKEAVFVLLLCLFGFTLQFDSRSIKLHKHENYFVENTDFHSYETLKYNRAGSSIPMEGGLLVLGTYYTSVSIGTPAKQFNLLV